MSKVATIKLRNWQDGSCTQLERAKAVIADKNTNLTKLSKKTNIPYQSLVNYRSDISKLDKASWQRINVLSQVYDILEKSDDEKIVDEKVQHIIKLSQKADEKLRELAEAQNKTVSEIIEELILLK